MGGALSSLTAGSSSGDFQDSHFSPNDPFFMPHHGNMDRGKFKWMLNNADAADYFYGDIMHHYCTFIIIFVVMQAKYFSYSHSLIS